MENLLDVISHGTTVEDFLATFDNDAHAAAAHLREVYEENLANSDVQPDEDEIDFDDLESNTITALEKYI